MRARAILIAALAATLTSAHGGPDRHNGTEHNSTDIFPGIDDLFGACAESCYRTISLPTPTATTHPTEPPFCATPIPTALESCLSASCSGAAAALSTISSAASSACSVFSSCSSLAVASPSATLPAACREFEHGHGGPKGGHRGRNGTDYWPDDWVGTSGCSYFTVTASSGAAQSTGWTTTDVTLTSTVGGSATVLTTAISATVVKAEAVASSSSSVVTTSSATMRTRGGPVGGGMTAMACLIVVSFVAMVAL